MSTITSEIRLRIRADGDKVLADLGAKLNNLANQATISSTKFGTLAAELKQVQATTVQSTSNLKAYSASWRELAGSVDIASKEFKQATAEAARLDAQVAKAQGTKSRGGRLAGAAQTVGTIAAAGVFGGPEGIVGAGIGAAVGGPMGAAVGGAIGAQVGGIRQALGATGDYVAELSKLRIALAGVSKDQADYEKNLSNVNKLSNQFLLPLKDTTQQYTKLQASVAGAGLSTKETETVFRGISAAIIATGGTTEDLNSALRATSQVFSKGKVSAEELRQQIGERLPGAFTIFAASLNKTPQELDKALEDGKVTLNDFLKFSEELFKRYGKTASIIADAPQNAGARLTIALDKLNIEIGRFIQPIGAQFQSLATGIVNALTPAIAAFNELINAPKLLAKERLPQIQRELKEENSKLIQARNIPAIPSFLPGTQAAAAAQRASSTARIKQLKGEELIIKETLKQTGSGTGTPPPTAGGGAGTGAGAKKTANDAAEARMQENVNKMQATFDKQKLAILQGISDAQLKINILKVDENNENREATANKIVDFKLAIADRQYELKKKELNLNSYKDKLKINLEDNVQLRNAKLKANQQALSTDLTKLEIDNTTEINAIYTNQTDNLKKQTDEKQKFLKELDKEIKLYSQSGNQAKEEIEIRLRMRNAKPRELEAALEDAAIRRKTKELRDQKQQEFTDQGFTGDDITSKINDLDAAGIKLLEAAEGTRRLKQQIEDLNATDFTQGIRNGVTTYLESIGTLSENVKEVTGSALQGLGDQLGNFVTTGKASFTDLANSIIKDMIRITTQQLIMKPLLGALGSLFPGGGGGGGGLPGFGMDSIIPGIGSGNTPAFKFANGGIMTEMGPMMMKKYAKGGIATGPQMALYGEGSQNEAYVPLPDGRRIPVAMQGGGGGSTSVVVNVDATGSNVEGNDQDSKQLGTLLAAVVQKELVKQKRPGGILA